MEEQAGLIQKSKAFFDNDRRSVGYTSPTRTNYLLVNYSNWIASSWYPTIKNDQKKSKIPEDNVFSTVTEAATITPAASIAPLEYDPKLVDEYGWVQVGTRYYNVEADIYVDEYPLSQEEN
jgi:hypothetical protein